MKRHAPATTRNREPLLEVLREVLPDAGLVLEVASGTGEHAVHFAARLPRLTWQPTDADEDSLASIRAWSAEADLTNLRAPLRLDASSPEWPVARADALVCINMIHIAPWAACLGLLQGAGRVLPAEGPLVLYGPFFRDGVPTAPSNRSFDQGLRAQNPDWGVRRLEDVAAAAATRRLSLDRLVELPSNNCAVVFRAGRG
jgi:hypothetical protein